MQAPEEAIDELRALDQIAHEHEQRHRDQHVVRHHPVGALHHQVEHLLDREVRVDAPVGDPGEEHAHAHQGERGRKAQHDRHHDHRQHDQAERALVGAAQVPVDEARPGREDQHRDHDQRHDRKTEPHLLADLHDALSLVT
jgi:hypothetical protein